MSLLLESWFDRLKWHGASGTVEADEVLRGDSETGLYVIVARSSGTPSKSDMQALWRARASGSIDPLLLAVEHEVAGKRVVTLLGPDKDAMPVGEIEIDLAERLLEHALKIESPIGLSAELRRRLSAIQSGVGPGFRNEGLFATHVLAQQPSRADWPEICKRSKPLLRIHGEPLLKQLGYSVETVRDGFVLRDATADVRRAAAILLTDDESFDNPLSRFYNATAVAHGLAVARRESVPWLIVLGGSVARLFPVDPDVGVGRKGQTQTYAEVDLDLLTDATAGYLALLFSPAALAADGTVSQLLAESSKYATSLSARLRDRIYADVIPVLAVSVAEKQGVPKLPAEEQKAALDEAYHQAMIILFRLLFVAYAEDRALLPLDTNASYTANALKTLARRILDDGPDAALSSTSSSMWDDLTQIWKVIDRGDLETMGVPAYNGGLFTADAAKNPSGASTYSLDLKNDAIGRVLRGLMIDETVDGVLGLVDFRSLDVREFGTIYEGLLESGLGIADTDLAVDSNDTFVPAKTGDKVLVHAGSVYFHSRSGSRKATGSYFTKPFAVQHLLDQALEPAITEHLARVRQMMASGKTKRAADALFDFRVADLSMGSAHFLVAAIDRIEARFSEFLAVERLPEVAAELQHLRNAAASQLGLTPADTNIDDGMLLRRQIARRCIYGVDINEIAVELARLAVWIHTFVPGLPLSFLNHGLIWGDSLTGVGTIDEIVESLTSAVARETSSKSSAGHVYESIGLRTALDELLDRASEALEVSATLADASIADVGQASNVHRELAVALAPLSALCDLITAERTTRDLPKRDPNKLFLVSGVGNDLLAALSGEGLERAILRHPALERARDIASSIHASHLPVCFPEVFRRTPSGFDALIGNPPWEKPQEDEREFWAVVNPGLRGLAPAAQQQRMKLLRESRPDLVAEFEDRQKASDSIRRVLLASPYKGMGKGHPDLYKAFAWRFVALCRAGGSIGVVMPRSLVTGAGTADWRDGVLRAPHEVDVTMLHNTGQWVFDNVHPQDRFVLLCVQLAGAGGVMFRGPFESMSAFVAGRAAEAHSYDLSTVRNWGAEFALPWLPNESAAAILAQMCCAKRLGDLPISVRPVQGDFNMSQDSGLWGYAGEGSVPVYKGGSIELWNPDTGTYYSTCKERDAVAALLDRRRRQSRVRSSAFHGLDASVLNDAKTLPYASPRIAFMDITNQSNRRTVQVSLVPPRVVLTHKIPYLYLRDGSAGDTAFLLGVLASIPLDWFARRFVEKTLSFEILKAFPVPWVADNPESGTRLSLRCRVEEIAVTLARVDQRFDAWAVEAGGPTVLGTAQPDKPELVAELDALVALLYGLSAEQVVQVFASFHRGWDYQSRLERVLVHYEVWSKRI